MDEFKFLLWTVSSHILNDEKLALRVNSLAKASKIVEEEINSSGGIFNKPVRIIYREFSPQPEGYDEVIDFVNREESLVAMTGAGTQKIDDYILDKIDINNILYFTFLSDHKIKHDNIFITTETDRASKIEFADFYINNHSKGKKIFFFHEGTRYKVEFLPILEKSGNEYTDYDLSQIITEQDLDQQLTPLIQKINDRDVILLDVKPNYLLHIFNYLNDNGKTPTVLKFYGLIDGRIEEYKFPLIDISNPRSGHALSYASLCDQIDPNLSPDDKSFIFNSIYRVEIPLLVAYASKKLDTVINDRQLFVSEISKRINAIDGVEDVFIGKSRVYAYKDNRSLSIRSEMYLFPRSLQRNNQLHRVLYPVQFLRLKNQIVQTHVNSVYIDIIRITKIDIGGSIWSCEFFLDILSPHDNPLDIINFNNLSLINSKFESKLIKKDKDKDFESTNFRYYIVANFDFLAVADNYPFDWQHIYIAMSITDQEKYGIIEPVPEPLMDYDFQLDGWRLVDAKTGILRQKEVHHQNRALDQVVQIREEIRVGWTIARTNVVTTMKVAIPIIFLMSLNYYTFFLPFDKVSTSIGILTTTFLSGIALYFSTEKPQPLRITTIDLIFIYYYLQVGIAVIVTAITGFTNKILYNDAMIVMKFVLPISIVFGLLFLYNRIKSVRLRPRID